jgi:hypothetical protein
MTRKPPLPIVTLAAALIALPCAVGISASHAASSGRLGAQRAHTPLYVERGRRTRSSLEEQFRREHPCPSTGKGTGDCPGYVIGYVTPLDQGGEDAPANMQWLEAAKTKTK